MPSRRRLRPSSAAGMKRASSGSLGWGASAHDGNHFRLMRAAAAAGRTSEDGADTQPIPYPYPNSNGLTLTQNLTKPKP